MEKSGAFFLISIVFWLVGILILLTSPYGSYPDEQSHYNYAKHIRTEGNLPPVDYSGRTLIPESFQPPFFYLVASLTYVPALSDPGNIRVMRLISLLFGWLTVWITWKAASLTFSNVPGYALLATAFVAFNAQFLFIHTGISNISLASFLGGLTTFVAVTILCSEQKSNRLALYLGLAFGGAILSRIACIYLLPVCGGVLLYKWMEEKSSGKFLRAVLLFTLGTTVVCGWWFLRNWVYYDDPIFWRFHQDVIGTGFTQTEPVTAGSLLLSGIYLNASFWAFFGKQQYHAGIAEYAVYFIFQALALVGSFHLLLSKRITSFAKRGFATMAAGAFMAITIVLWIQTQIRAPQGRYFFMAITPIAIVLSGGLLQLVPVQSRLKAAITLTLFLLILCIYLLLRYWVPRYAPNI